MDGSGFHWPVQFHNMPVKWKQGFPNHRLRLGAFDKARKEAKRLRSEVVLGGDPASAKQERRGIPTYAEFSAQHLAHAKTYQRRYDTTEMYIRRHIIPRWGKHRLTEIDQQAVSI